MSELPVTRPEWPLKLPFSTPSKPSATSSAEQEFALPGKLPTGILHLNVQQVAASWLEASADRGASNAAQVFLMPSPGTSSCLRKTQTFTTSFLVLPLAVTCLAFSASAQSAVPGAASVQPASFRVLYQFTNPTDGGGPAGRLVRDDHGNLYGVGGGGPDNYGVVFKLSPGGQETVLYSFSGTDGSHPGAGLVRDADGNLYGTTSEGGPKGYGNVFRFTASGVFSVLHSFHGAPDGASPEGDLLLDAAGNLYGTTLEGGQGCSNPYGASGCGTVFEITANGKEKILYRFADSPDGAHPNVGLVPDQDGNLYGVTGSGGNVFEGTPLGTVYRITPGGKETVLHRFDGESAGDGQNPASSLIMDENGDLYGTTVEGGPNGGGTVFKLTQSGAETILYSFPGSADDGQSPDAGLVRDRDGNLYGTTPIGGAEITGCAGSGCGVVFRLTPSNAETVIHSFTDNGNDGCTPYTALITDGYGALFGSTPFCGTSGNGTIFKFSY
jgi:uncharacterized repeat protein (TIGR03803 family)